MSDENDESKTPEILYQGSAVPRLLRWVYLAFGIWATYYLVKNLAPDLAIWLSSPHV